MQYEKHVKVVKENREEEYCYYVKENEKTLFDCKMYNVGIINKDNKAEIEDFSPSFEEAVELCDYLCNETVSVKNIFLIAEEFIS